MGSKLNEFEQLEVAVLKALISIPRVTISALRLTIFSSFGTTRPVNRP